MTDPRIAALAEALLPRFAARYGGEPFDELSWKMAREDAAAILAALPPDWCGHRVAMSRTYEALEESVQRQAITITDQMAEITRLRAALRDIADGEGDAGASRTATRIARAALEADR